MDTVDLCTVIMKFYITVASITASLGTLIVLINIGTMEQQYIRVQIFIIQFRTGLQRFVRAKKHF